jgi:RNA polymerase sigma-70 factor (ECF subfamily)
MDRAPPDPAEAALVAAVRAGDQAALDAWIRREHPAAYRVCFGILLDAAEAEDAAQDAMLRLLDRLGQWDARRPFATWRNAIVTNLCRDRLRSAAARRRVEQRSAPAEAAGALPDPADAASAREVRHALVACLGHLTPREREVFVLKDLEDQETAEVAEALGLTQSTVRSLLTLARRRLRGLLARRLPELAAARGPTRGDADAS